MTSAIDISEPPVIEYPENDGLPIADNTLQFRRISTIMWGLDALFSKTPDVFVAGNLLWYPVKGSPTIRIGPDVLVAFGRPKGDRRSYQQWNEGNVPPQVVFEVLSPGNRPGAMGEKFEFYQEHGVEEYYIYDPDDGSLSGWLRAGGRLEAVPRMSGFVSPRLRIEFDPGPGADNLRIFRPDGARFLTYLEQVEKSEADQRRADEERQRAEEERRQAAAERGRADEQARLALADRKRAEEASRLAALERERADAATERAERLAARLRELGLDPE